VPQYERLQKTKQTKKASESGYPQTLTLYQNKREETKQTKKASEAGYPQTLTLYGRGSLYHSGTKNICKPTLADTRFGNRYFQKKITRFQF
jgi:hypothetical protein